MHLKDSNKIGTQTGPTKQMGNLFSSYLISVMLSDEGSKPTCSRVEVFYEQ